MTKLIQLILIFFCFSLKVQGKVLKVPAQYSSIQLALDNASKNDTILLYPGTYVESLMWPKFDGINMLSVGNNVNTIIVAETNNRNITFPHSNLYTNNTRIAGITFKGNGYISDDIKGGAIFLSPYSSPRFDSIKFGDYNIETLSGGNSKYQGLIYISDHSSPVFNYCTIEDVQVAGYQEVIGGVIYISDNSHPKFDNLDVQQCKFSSCDILNGGVFFISNFSNPLFSNVISGSIDIENLNNCFGLLGHVNNFSKPRFINLRSFSNDVRSIDTINGGSFFITGQSYLNITDSWFSGFELFGEYNNVFIGGTISVTGRSNINLSNSRIGGVRLYDGYINEAYGGLIYLNDIGDSTFFDKIIMQSTYIKTAKNNIDGGVIYINSSSPQFKNINIENSTFYSDGKIRGGGIYITQNSTPSFENFSIYNLEINNERSTGDSLIGGVGIFINNNSKPTFINGQITLNQTKSKSNNCKGGVINVSNKSEPNFINMTIVDNSSPIQVQGPLVYADKESLTEFINCIIFNPNSNSGSEIETNNSDVNIIYSNIRNSYPGIGNINQEPVFEKGDYGCYFLKTNSPGYNAGTLNNAPITDAHGTQRITENKLLPSMGALELIPLDPLGSDVVICEQSYSIDSIQNEFGIFEWGILYQIPVTSRTMQRIGKYAGCSITDNVTFEIVNLPKIDLGDDITLCEFPIIIDGGSASRDFLWNTGDSLNKLKICKSGEYSVLVTNSHGCSASDTIIISACSDQNLKYEINMFPNPVSELLEICVQENLSISAISIFDSSGKIIYNQKLESKINHTKINVSHLNSGTYFLKIDLIEGETINKTFVVLK